MLKKGICKGMGKSILGLLFILIIASCGRKMTGDAAFEKKMFAKAVKIYSKDLEVAKNDTISSQLAFKIAES